MGCGCSNSKAVAISDIHQYSVAPTSPERMEYLMRKREQILVLLEELSLSRETHPELDGFVSALTKDCQGFTTSPTGGETSTLKEHIDKLMTYDISKKTLVESCLKFIRSVVKATFCNLHP